MIYVAFLRSINVGSRNIKMDELRLALAKLGFAQSQTVLASGNVIFHSPAAPDIKALETGLREIFSIDIGVVVRSLAELVAMVEQDPFAAYEAGKERKFYLTMATAPIKGRLDNIASVPGDFDLVRVDKKDFFSVAFRQPGGRFGPGLNRLEKCFKDLTITTRNWNTITRIIKKGQPMIKKANQ